MPLNRSINWINDDSILVASLLILKLYITEKEKTVFCDKFLAKRIIKCWGSIKWNNDNQKNFGTYYDGKTWKQCFNSINTILIWQTKLNECNKQIITNTLSVAHWMLDWMYN